MKIEYDENVQGYYISEDGKRVSEYCKKENDVINLLDTINQLEKASIHEGEES